MTARHLVSQMDSAVSVVGDMGEIERERNFSMFEKGLTKVLVTTNFLSRSIDVPKVKVVINFDAPTHVQNQTIDFKTYHQRIGRAGRFGQFLFSEYY